MACFDYLPKPPLLTTRNMAAQLKLAKELQILEECSWVGDIA